MIYDPAEEDRTYYETYVPGKPNSHMRAGGCQECNPDTPIPPAQMREYQKVLATEFSREGEFHDTVNDGCITDIVITGEVRRLSFFWFPPLSGPLFCFYSAGVYLLSSSCR